MQSGSPGGFTSVPASGSPSGVTNVTVSAYGGKPVNGGRFDFDDGGTYCGGWEDGKAHGHGVCTGPKGQGEYSGSWHFGFEVSGVYTWPSGSTFEGQWQNGKRHGLGTEYRGRWTYRGEWTQGFKGRYGVRQATASNAKYEGTWANGLQDGYGSETYADGGTFQGQWLRGLRHGYGVRTSAPFGMASHFRPKAPQGSLVSLKSEATGEPTTERDRRIDDVRGGFVLRTRSDEPPARRKSLVERSSNFKESILKGLKLRKQRSTGDIDKKGTNTSIRSTHSSASWMSNDSAQSGVTSGSHHTDSNASFIVEDEHMDTNVTETYMGEWKNDKRSGFGISERSDGLKYEGEWYNNKKYGYGVTTFKDGTKEEGKYKNNVLITSQKKKHLFLMRSAKFRERIDAAVNAAQRASKIALQKADIAISRTATARGKAEQADIGAAHAREDSEIARITAKQFAPDFHQPGTEALKPQRNQHRPTMADLSNKIGATRNDDLQLAANLQSQRTGPYSSKAPGTREQSQEPRFADDPYHQQQQQQINPSAFSQNNPHSDQMISDRLDRNSLVNQPIDSSQYAHQFQQHPQQQQQQQYMNRHGEVPTGGMYQSTASQRLSHQNLMDINGGMESSKPQMGNSTHAKVGGMSGGFAPAARNPMMMDSNSHSHQLQIHGGHMPTSTSMDSGFGPQERERGRETSRRSHLPPMSRQNNPNPASGYQQAMSDHFDHYKRAPSRDSSVDRFNSRTRSRTRAPTPEIGPGPGSGPAPSNPHSRAPSRQRTPFGEQPATMMRSSTANLDFMMGMDPGVMRRGDTPARGSGKDSPAHGGLMSDTASVFSGGGPIDELILRQKGLGQEIPPVPYTPKRTESLFLKSAIPKAGPSASLLMASGGGGGVTVKRKKSLPDAVTLPKAVQGISREECSTLGSARRQEVRRMQDDAERLRANPLLYLLNPNIKNWFSRQRLMVLVLFINLSLAIMFLQLLT